MYDSVLSDGPYNHYETRERSMPVDAWYFADDYVRAIVRRDNGYHQSISVRRPGELNHWTISSRHEYMLISDQSGCFTGMNGAYANKDDLFESVRKDVSPEAPSRRDCFFAFVTEQGARDAQTQWRAFVNLSLEPIQIQDDAVTFKADADFYTNASRYGTIRAAALRYWLGQQTLDPKWEYLVHGTVFFSNWAAFPTFDDLRVINP